MSGVAPFPDPSRPTDAPLPVVRPVNSSLDEEAIEIKLAPGMKPVNWNPGDYRVTDLQVLIDRSRTFTLTGTLLPPGASRTFRRLPALHAAVSETEFTTTEQTSWRFNADRSAATVRIGVHVRRGTLFQFGLRVPGGYALARVGSSPDELIAHTGTAERVATVEFARPLSAGHIADLTFEFRGPRLAPLPSRLPFPVFEPIGAAERVGVIGIDGGALWTIDAIPGTGTQPANWLDLNEPGVPAGATVAFRYRGGNPDGSVTLAPVRAEFTADTATRVALVPGALNSTTTITIRLLSGALTSILLIEPLDGAMSREWRVLGRGNAVAGVTQVFGRIWLVRFARPVTDDVTLETTATRAVPTGTLAGGPWEWQVPGATPAQANALPVAPQATPQPVWTFSDLYLVSTVRSPSDVVVVYGGKVNSSAGSSLPIRLPDRAQVRAVGVGGHGWNRAAVSRHPKGYCTSQFHRAGRFASRCGISCPWRFWVQPCGFAVPSQGCP